MCQLPKEGVPSLSHRQCNPFSFSDLCALAQTVEWQQRARSWSVRAVPPAHPWASTPAHEHRNRAGDSECLPLLGYPHCLSGFCKETRSLAEGLLSHGFNAGVSSKDSVGLLSSAASSALSDLPAALPGLS